MTDQEILEFISRNGGHPRAFFRFATVLLRHLEDIVWQWHDEGRYEDRVGPLFIEGGPPRYHFCCGDPQEERARRDLLSQRQRGLIGFGQTYILALRRRLWMLTGDGAARPAHAWRRMYDTWRYFADGREMQLQIRGMAFALGYAHGVGTGRGAAMAASRERIPVFPESVPTAGAPAAARTTLQGMGPDIGHADMLPAIAARQPARTLPGLGPGPSSPPTPTGQTLRGIGPEIEVPRPPSAPGGSTRTPPPNDMRPLVEEASAEASTARTEQPSSPSGRQRFVHGRLPPSGRAVPLSAQEHQALVRSPYFAPGGVEAHRFFPAGYSDYAAEWQIYGGVGSAPQTGFVVQNADGSRAYIALFIPAIR